MASVQSPDKPLPAGLSVKSLGSFPGEPWRNGGGTTRTLVQDSDGGWRISLADVKQDGPYSQFPGMTRSSLVLKGDGVTLRNGDVELTLRPRNAAVYDGDRTWTATLHGEPVLALNAIAKRGRYRTNVEMLSENSHVPPVAHALIVNLCGSCTMLVGEIDKLTVEAGDVLIRGTSGPSLRCVETSKSADVALVTIESIFRR
ncbi:HutD family protein [Paraburkholderia sp. UCT2]|uniref:HutD/Ves family protein n=1 Tax=Paraburkholderia sp. UCT2 TaxID=2615208 RepID=UPI001655EF0D|nr:HutD family protein [Paraburkholderia sp. UCT2]MBC8727753.1 HutD family protein [Paraburkholderia sp. UCT2]